MYYSADNLALKIKAFRTAAGLTQAELAGKLFVSPQTVSKWELGVTVPEIDTLCAAAEFFGVGVSELLIGEYSGDPVVIGVDGGGTKTEFVMADKEGHILKRTVLGTGNPTAVGIEKTCETVIEGISKLLSGGERLAAVCCGIAGCSERSRSETIKAEIKKRYPSAAVSVSSDIMNVFNCLPDPENSIAAICGTGVAVFAYKGGSLYRVGGWGQLFDERGSGYDIGREAVRVALAEADGFGKRSAITDGLKKRLGSDIFKAIIKPENQRRDVIASFSPIVFDAYDSGDGEAERILDENFRRVAKLIDFAAEKYGCRGPVVMSGGLLSEKDTVFRFISDHLKSNVKLTVLELPQVCGACFAALKSAGIKTDAKMLDTVGNTYGVQ